MRLQLQREKHPAIHSQYTPSSTRSDGDSEAEGGRERGVRARDAVNGVQGGGVEEREEEAQG